MHVPKKEYTSLMLSFNLLIRTEIIIKKYLVKSQSQMITNSVYSTNEEQINNMEI